MRGIGRRAIASSMALVAWLASGCASTGYASYDVVGTGQTAGENVDAIYEQAAPASAPMASLGARQAAPPAPVLATNGPATIPPTPTEHATDAERASELRIYTADIVMAVFDVRATQDAIVQRVQALGGYLASRDDSMLVVRVPAARFEEGVAAAEGEGQVVQRNVRAEDVTAQYRDLEIRIRTLDAMRTRLERMLERAANVQEALAVERELERVTVELESLRGQLRYLGDRVAYSTITLRFRVLAPTEIPDAGRPRLLPFRWLRDLGLAQLLDL